jgi:hypothetical protein
MAQEVLQRVALHSRDVGINRKILAGIERR